MGMTLIIILVAAVAFALFVVALYNKLVRLRVDCDNGWSQIDVQLKRRYDLVPNLIETVKGYASHERETLEAVVQARTRAQEAQGVKAQAEAENMLTQALGRIFALSEAYPDLKANQNFLSLQEELTSTENKIGFARQHYNDCVARYSTSIQQFPSNIVAGMFSFKPRDYFELDTAAAREVPKVSFSKN
ncbi:MAG: LemA family protein [Phycisphaerales bacterium]|nr:MAG: LemA family protein [Phycisphaerales bacterium]